MNEFQQLLSETWKRQIRKIYNDSDFQELLKQATDTGLVIESGIDTDDVFLVTTADDQVYCFESKAEVMSFLSGLVLATELKALKE